VHTSDGVVASELRPNRLAMGMQGMVATFDYVDTGEWVQSMYLKPTDYDLRTQPYVGCQCTQSWAARVSSQMARAAVSRYVASVALHYTQAAVGSPEDGGPFDNLTLAVRAQQQPCRVLGLPVAAALTRCHCRAALSVMTHPHCNLAR
jgi:hypothetical protein